MYKRKYVKTRYSKAVRVQFTRKEWQELLNWSNKAKLEPQVYIRKILLDFLNLKDHP